MRTTPIKRRLRHKAQISQAMETAVESPFWSDDFDMDFPKIFPDARQALGELGDVELWGAGRPDKNGRLNHPAVWNGDDTMLSFFGFRSSRKPGHYVCDEEVQCTAWDVFRDAWPHGYLITVERRPVWDTFRLRRQFDAIMWDLRGWRSQPTEAAKAKDAVMRSYRLAIREFGRIVDAFPASRQQADINL